MELPSRILISQSMSYSKDDRPGPSKGEVEPKVICLAGAARAQWQ
jgi:hypothetical protein